VVLVCFSIDSIFLCTCLFAVFFSIFLPCHIRWIKITKAQLYLPHLHLAPQLGVIPSECHMSFALNESRCTIVRRCLRDPTFSRFRRTPIGDRQTDGRWQLACRREGNTKLFNRSETARHAVLVEIYFCIAVRKITLNTLAVGNDLECDSRSSELPLFDKPHTTSYEW